MVYGSIYAGSTELVQYIDSLFPDAGKDETRGKEAPDKDGLALKNHAFPFVIMTKPKHAGSGVFTPFLVYFSYKKSREGGARKHG